MRLRGKPFASCNFCERLPKIDRHVFFSRKTSSWHLLWTMRMMLLMSHVKLFKRDHECVIKMEDRYGIKAGQRVWISMGRCFGLCHGSNVRLSRGENVSRVFLSFLLICRGFVVVCCVVVSVSFVAVCSSFFFHVSCVFFFSSFFFAHSYSLLCCRCGRTMLHAGHQPGSCMFFFSLVF